VLRGMVEAESKTGEVFGTKRLSAVLETCREYDLSTARHCTIDALELHSTGTPRAEDQTSMVIEVWITATGSIDRFSGLGWTALG